MDSTTNPIPGLQDRHQGQALRVEEVGSRDSGNAGSNDQDPGLLLSHFRRHSLFLKAKQVLSISADLKFIMKPNESFNKDMAIKTRLVYIKKLLKSSMIL